MNLVAAYLYAQHFRPWRQKHAEPRHAMPRNADLLSIGSSTQPMCKALLQQGHERQHILHTFAVTELPMEIVPAESSVRIADNEDVVEVLLKKEVQTTLFKLQVHH